MQTILKLALILLPALLTHDALVGQDPGGKDKAREYFTETDLDLAIDSITGGKDAKQKLGYDGKYGYVNADGKVVTKEKGKEVEFQALGCSAFASAVVHRLQKGSFQGISTKVHQEFGGKPLARHYGLEQARSTTATEFLADMADKSKRKAAAGVYLFELDGEALLEGGKTEPRAHVGFLLIAETKVRQVHFSGLKKYQGLADDERFHEFVEGSLYKDAKGKKATTLTLWKLPKPTK
jgi:hypothetical protein